jgi:hypothetical protein
MSKKAFIVLAVTIALSFVCAGPVAAGSDRVPRVVPCSLDGVNPVYHPSIFGNPAFAKARYGFVRGRDGSWHVEPNCRKPWFIGPAD